LSKINKQKTLPFTCPICGRKAEHPVSALTEGAELICPFCKLKLILHGHMWQEVQQELAKLGARVKGQGSSKGSPKKK
jgi:hypothetical protein